MSARYQVLSNEKQPLYAEGSPVILVAKALTKDTVQNKVLAQIRFKSISKNMLTALTVALLPKDAAGRPIGSEAQHTYLDLNISRDSEFGADQAIYFDNETIRDYDVVVKECIYKNEGACQISKTLQPIKAPQTLDGLDADMLQQYRSDIHCANAKYKYQTILDLWQCTCGEYNHNDEQVCHSCNSSRFVVQDGPDMQALSRKIGQRKQELRKEEQRIQEETRSLKEEARKKQKKVATIVGICIVLACAATAVAMKVTSDNKTKAVKAQIESYIADGKYSQAYEEILGADIKDSEKEEYVLQTINGLYAEHDFATAKEYADSITSEDGKQKIADIKAEYIDPEAYQKAQSSMSTYVNMGKVPLDFLVEARDNGIDFENEKSQDCADRALYLYDTYAGAYKIVESNTLDGPYYIVFDLTGIYCGHNLYQSENYIRRFVASWYYVDSDSIGDGMLYEKDGKLVADIWDALMPLKDIYPLESIPEANLPSGFMARVKELQN